MAARFNSSDWNAHNARALHRDGDLCLACFAQNGGRDPGPLLEPTLDHMDADKRNNRGENIIRLCRGHNAAEENRTRPARRAWRKASPEKREALPPVWKLRVVNPETYPGLRAAAAEIIRKRPGMEDFQKPSGPRGKGEGGRETGEPNPLARWTMRKIEDDRDVENARIQQDRMQPEYRLWVFEQVKEHGSISKADAILSGTAVVQDATGKGAKSTILDYFDTITSRAGWLRESRNADGRLVYVFRDGLDIHRLEKQLRGYAQTLRDLLRRSE